MKRNVMMRVVSAVVVILSALVLTTEMNPAPLWLLIASTLAYASTDRDRGSCCVSRLWRRRPVEPDGARFDVR
jgi:hypothetical protein